jgi:hypothetical protein
MFLNGGGADTAPNFFPNYDQTPTRYWGFGTGWTTLFPLNTPVHVCFTWNNTKQAICGYINGALRGSESGSGAWTASAWANSEVCGLGGVIHPTLDLQSRGHIGDPLIYDHDIEAAQIQQPADPSNVMLSGLIKPVQGTTRYFRGVTLSDAYTLKPPLVHVSHGVSRPQNFTLDYSHPLANGLVFAGLGNVPGSVRYNDSSAWGNHGALTNMDPKTDWVWSPVLNRWNLDSSGNEWVSCGTSPVFEVQSHSFACWVYPTASSTYARMIVHKSTSIVSNGFEWGLRGDLLSYAYYDGGIRGWYQDTTTIPLNTWTHVCGVWNKESGVASYYVNGQYSSQDSTTTGTITHSAAAPLSIGHVLTNDYFSGKMSDFALYNRELAAPEISQLADPSNVLLSGLIRPILDRPIPVPINDRHWVGRDSSDWHGAANWSRSQGGRGGAGVPNENTNVYFD